MQLLKRQTITAKNEHQNRAGNVRVHIPASMTRETTGENACTELVLPLFFLLK